MTDTDEEIEFQKFIESKPDFSYFEKHSPENSVQEFYYWLYLRSPRGYFKSTQYGNRFGIHPYIRDQYEIYKKEKNLDSSLKLHVSF